MNSLWKYLQYAYLIIGAIFLVEGVLTWTDDREKAIFMFVFAIFIVLIFFFKRHFRKKVEERNQNR